MLKMTLEEFNTGFNYLVGHFPNTKNLKSVSYAYFEDLKEVLTGEEFIASIKKIIRSNKKNEFIPKVAEIIEMAKGDIDIEKQLILAKRMLKTSITRYGSTGMICFEDKGIHAVIDYIGWNRLCMMTNEEFDNFLNFQFDGIYKSFVENPYESSEYYTGTNKLFGQKTPVLVTYASIGIKTENMKFIPLEYKVETRKIPGIESLKKKMLIGG